ncbi:MAG TPA: LacI family DNA-binding transcriptional regulator [Acidisarcina sp.]|nr:LacI family DNA-binding transcriptional regulator [Acidisarcina sp.]
MSRKSSSVPTIADVARECGVGSMTVSRVVNGGRYVSPATAKRVRAAIARLGYEPNEAARILKGQASRTIGLILPDLGDPFFSACAHAVQLLAARHGYRTLLSVCEGNVETELEELAVMKARKVAGILVIPSNKESIEPLATLRARGVPVVMLDRTLPGLDAGEVMVDNAGGAQKAVNHLVQHGHRKILCIGYNSRFNSIGQRIAGYESAMTAAGLVPQVLAVEDDSSVGPQLLQCLRSSKPPTAIFSLNNVTTTQVLHLLQRENIQIPGDVALIGFDDFELASLLAVPLTAVNQPAGELGRSGTRMLLDWIRTGTQEMRSVDDRVVLPVELVIRRSCGCDAPPRIRSSRQDN